MYKQFLDNAVYFVEGFRAEPYTVKRAIFRYRPVNTQLAYCNDLIGQGNTAPFQFVYFIGQRWTGRDLVLFHQQFQQFRAEEHTARL